MAGRSNYRLIRREDKRDAALLAEEQALVPVEGLYIIKQEDAKEVAGRILMVDLEGHSIARVFMNEFDEYRMLADANALFKFILEECQLKPWLIELNYEEAPGKLGAMVYCPESNILDGRSFDPEALLLRGGNGIICIMRHDGVTIIKEKGKPDREQTIVKKEGVYWVREAGQEDKRFSTYEKELLSARNRQ
jgi:hypothetical protein